MRMDIPFNQFSQKKLEFLGITTRNELNILYVISRILEKVESDLSGTYKTYYDEEENETYIWFNYEKFINRNMTSKVSKIFIKKTIKKLVDSRLLKRKNIIQFHRGSKTYFTFGELYDWAKEYVYFYDEDCYARDSLHENIILTDKEYTVIIDKMKELKLEVDKPYELLMYMNDLSGELYKSNTEIDNPCGYILNILNEYAQEVLH